MHCNTRVLSTCIPETSNASHTQAHMSCDVLKCKQSRATICAQCKMKYSQNQLETNLKEALAVLRQYDWLIDSYVLVCVYLVEKFHKLLQ